MNKQRRKELASIHSDIQVLVRMSVRNDLDADDYADLRDRCEELHDRLSSVKEDEAEAKDNLPESLQYSERGEAMDTAIQYMEDAMEAMLECQLWFDRKADGEEDKEFNVRERLDDAAGYVDDASSM